MSAVPAKAPFVPRPVAEILAELGAQLAYYDQLFGVDGDCGESAKMISINDLRVLVRHGWTIGRQLDLFS